MKPNEIVSLVTAIIGAMLGTAGFVISILAFLRDRPRVRVTLVWDLEQVGGSGERIGLVNVANIGRRPICIGAVVLQAPKHYKWDGMLLKDSIQAIQLIEGAPPAKFPVNYIGLKTYKADWSRIRAYAEDSAGRKYYSNYPEKKPSWAE
jgi:hypothetical protein